MSIASRIESIEQHLEEDYDVLTLAGADLTNVDKNIVNLKPTWKERLLYFINNGTDEVWNNWNKVTGEGEEISLNNTLEAKMKIELKGNTSQETTTGKNLCYIDDKTNSSSGLDTTSLNQKITITGRNTNTSSHAIIYYYHYPKFVAGETYTISVSDGSITDSGIYIQINTNKGALFTLWGEKTTFTVPSDYTNCTAFYIGASGTTTNVNVSFRLQIEQGSTKTTWEPYTGGYPSPNPDYPQDIQVVSGDNTIIVSNSDNTQSASYPINLPEGMELCKIGTYQDYIYKTDKWYLHKEIGETTFTGAVSEGWFRATRSDNTTHFYQTSLSGLNLGNTTVENELSNYFRLGNPYTDTGNSIWLFKSGNNEIARLGFDNETIDTTDKLKTWLSNNNTTVYYVLATPTNEEITDSTLLSQLNALEGANSYDNQTNVSQVNNDLASVLNATALQEIS